MLNLNMNIIIWSQLFEYYSNIELFTHLGFSKCSEVTLKEIDFFFFRNCIAFSIISIRILGSLRVLA